MNATQTQPGRTDRPDHADRSGVQRWTNQVNKFRVLRIHYSADPDKNEDWYVKTRPGYSRTAWDQEHEITFVSYEGKGVFTNEYIPLPVEEGGHILSRGSLSENRAIYRVWDFGYHHPAVLFVQELENGHHYIFDELMGTDIWLQEFVPMVLEVTEKYKGKHLFIKDFCDPAGKAAKSTGKSDLAVLSEWGIRPVYAQFEIKDTINYVRNSLGQRRPDGYPTLLVDAERCPTLHDALQGGYRYAPVPEGRADKPLPLDDGYYEHLSDCLRYYHGHRLRLLPKGRSDGQAAAKGNGFTKDRFPYEAGRSEAPDDRRHDIRDPRSRYPAEGTFHPRTSSGVWSGGDAHTRGDGSTTEAGKDGKRVQRRQVVVASTFGGPMYSRFNGAGCP